MGYQDHAELTREFYRKQGEERERERIAKLLEEQLGTGDKHWSPVFVLNLIRGSECQSMNSLV
jgi:hypothetical protein